MPPKRLFLRVAQPVVTVFHPTMISRDFFPLGLSLALALWFAPAASAQDIPDYLLEDEHVREEFGVNDFTTPSIELIFADLRALRPLPYEALRRELPEGTTMDRISLALTAGTLIADGFHAVEGEQLLDLEPVGRSLLKHAKALGSGVQVSANLKSLIEKAADNDWESLRKELSKTQRDVEKEMVLLRDVDVANLLSLGGWLRAFEIGCAASLEPYDVNKAKLLGRPEVLDYFVVTADTLKARMPENQTLLQINEGLAAMRKLIELPEDRVLTEAEIVEMGTMTGSIIEVATGRAKPIPDDEIEGENGDQ